MHKKVFFAKQFLVTALKFPILLKFSVDLQKILVLPKYFLFAARKILILPIFLKFGGSPSGTAMCISEAFGKIKAEENSYFVFTKVICQCCSQVAKYYDKDKIWLYKISNY